MKDFSEIYDRGTMKGRFTREFLADMIWNGNPEYADAKAQQLLITFMEDCQICFPLSGERWDGYRFHEPV